MPANHGNGWVTHAICIIIIPLFFTCVDRFLHVALYTANLVVFVCIINMEVVNSTSLISQ